MENKKASGGMNRGKPFAIRQRSDYGLGLAVVVVVVVSFFSTAG